jgi:hypothetical protein
LLLLTKIYSSGIIIDVKYQKHFSALAANVYKDATLNYFRMERNSSTSPANHNQTPVIRY